jgi:hypothetical protein
MFASKGILEHLVRGVIGIGALLISLINSTEHPWLSMALIPVALVAFRGCPTCWIVGLFQTVIAKFQGKPSAHLCSDGSCALPTKAQPEPEP